MKKFFVKIQKSDLQEPPKFKQFVLPKFGSTASYHSLASKFFIKFISIAKFSRPKSIIMMGSKKILTEFKKIKQKLLKIA